MATLPENDTATLVLNGAEKILVVDDQFGVRRLLCEIFREDHHEVEMAANGAEALQLLMAFQPDLILMDINIPGVDGMEATARLKASDVKYIPIIALTANAMRGDRERIMAAGCDEYLQKPLSNALLLETVQRFIGLPTVEMPQASALPPIVAVMLPPDVTAPALPESAD